MKESGMKWDGDKPRMSLIPPGTMTRIAIVMTDVLTRTEPPPYVANSWREVRPVTRYTDALMRHLDHILAGVEKDPTSGLSPLWHLLTDAAILAWLLEEGHPIIPPNFEPIKVKGEPESPQSSTCSNSVGNELQAAELSACS